MTSAIAASLMMAVAVVGPAAGPALASTDAAPSAADAPSGGTAPLDTAVEPVVPASAGVGAGVAFRHFGGGPLDDVLAMATKYARPDPGCGLSVNRLAGMMMVPTFPESGSTSGNTSPSPMTLSRWDTQTALWAFGDKTTPYQGAFFHPGIGMWQFDSAGGWPLTAGTAINTSTAAEQAAKTISSGFCNSSSTDIVERMRAGWFPWFECHSGPLCTDYLDSIFDGTNLLIIRDDTIGSLGGASARTCSVMGIGTVPCLYVDPSQAQGDRDFLAPPKNGIPPTPITKPFYVFSANNREYRYWLRADTGYNVNIVASKLVTANARTGLTWSTVESSGGWLCDETAIRGSCAPFGVVDRAYGGVGSITATGWAIDPGTSDPTAVHLYLDGVGHGVAAADSRPDVGAAYPGYGSAHGFTTTISGVAPGAHTLCAYAIDISVPFATNSLMSCATVVVPSGSPVGTAEVFSPGANAVIVSGWALDPDTYSAASVTVVVDGKALATGTASAGNTAAGAAYPAWGTARGYTITAPGVSPGVHQVCVTALNVGSGANSSLGCRTMAVTDGSPLGAVTAWSSGYGHVSMSGWMIDPDTYSPIRAQVLVDGILYWMAPAEAGHAGVGIVYPPWSTPHGFSAVVTGLGGGMHHVCVYGTNVGAGANAPVGCQWLNVPSVAPNNDPVGWVENWSSGVGRISADGWTIDPNTFAPISVRAVVDGLVRPLVTADAGHAAVGQVYPAWGTPHGWALSVTGLAPGPHQVCIQAVNAGPGADSTLGCRVLGVGSSTPANDPFGWVSTWSGSGGTATVRGWMIDPDTYAPINVVVFVDAIVRSNVPADEGNASVGQVYPAWGTPHGFDVTVTGLAPGPHGLCVYAVNAGAGTSTQVECRTVTV